jgi:hypothetical protein
MRSFLSFSQRPPSARRGRGRALHVIHISGRDMNTNKSSCSLGGRRQVPAVPSGRVKNRLGRRLAPAIGHRSAFPGALEALGGASRADPGVGPSKPPRPRQALRRRCKGRRSGHRRRDGGEVKLDLCSRVGLFIPNSAELGMATPPVIQTSLLRREPCCAESCPRGIEG